MITVLRIDPDGTITPMAGDALTIAQDTYKHTTVVSCGSPLLHPYGDPRSFIGVIDDFGAQDLPANMKAWALYGRTPIYGTMWLAHDYKIEIPAELIATLSEPVESWVDKDVLAHCADVLKEGRPEMLGKRP